MRIFTIIFSTVIGALTAACMTATTPKQPVISLRPIAVNFTQPVTTGTVTFEDATMPPQTANIINGRAGFPNFPASEFIVNVHIRAEGFQPYDCVTHIPDGSYDFFVGPFPTTKSFGYGQGWFVGANGSSCPTQLTPLTPPFPQPVARNPLVLEPDGPDGLLCHHDLPPNVNIPTTPAINWWRGDAWGVTPLGGLPVVPGGSSVHPERALTWFMDRYPASAQDRILTQYRWDGYTHFALSWPDSRAFGTSPRDYVSLSLKVKAQIPYVAHFLTSKLYDPANADAPTRMAAVVPIVDLLVANHAIDILVVGWELDTFNDPQLLQDFIDALHTRYPTIPTYVHFTSYKTAWQVNGQPRSQFWVINQGKLRGLLYQGNQNDTCGQMQAHFNDAQVPASGLAGFVLVPWELVGANQFDGTNGWDEERGNARSWELLATPGPIPAAGFGNGGRYPNGNPTLTAYPE